MYIHNLAHYRQMVFMILRYADNALLTMGTPVYKIRDALSHRKVASSFDYLNYITICHTDQLTYSKLK